MTLVLRELYKYYQYYIIDARDTRLEHFFLMGSPLKAIAIAAGYWYFVKKLGPKLMEKREPFELKRIMMVYNLLQVIANFILGILGVLIYVQGADQVMCGLVDYSNTPAGISKAKVTYLYYLVKVTDLLDTVFFIMRKKFSQATFLHVYHHGFMVLMGYLYANYMPAGHATMMGLVNSFVHTAMYFYYFVTCINPNIKSSLQWKKRITQLQLLQFATMIIHFGHPLLFGNCKYPKAFLFMPLGQNLFMMAMFGDFYYKAYVMKKKKN